MVTSLNPSTLPSSLLPRRFRRRPAVCPPSPCSSRDIVIPAFDVALTHRDGHCAAESRHATPAPAKYFPSVMFGYFAGLATTIIVMNVFPAAQPALLYIVPELLGATSPGRRCREVKAGLGLFRAATRVCGGGGGGRVKKESKIPGLRLEREREIVRFWTHARVVRCFVFWLLQPARLSHRVL